MLDITFDVRDVAIFTLFFLRFVRLDVVKSCIAEYMYIYVPTHISISGLSSVDTESRE